MFLCVTLGLSPLSVFHDLTFNILIFEMKKVHSKLLSNSIEFSTAGRSGQKGLMARGRGGEGKAREPLNRTKKKIPVLPHGKILILKFTLLLTFKLKGIACNSTRETKAYGLK